MQYTLKKGSQLVILFFNETISNGSLYWYVLVHSLCKIHKYSNPAWCNKIFVQVLWDQLGREHVNQSLQIYTQYSSKSENCHFDFSSQTLSVLTIKNIARKLLLINELCHKRLFHSSMFLRTINMNSTVFQTWISMFSLFYIKIYLNTAIKLYTKWSTEINQKQIIIYEKEIKIK